MSWKANLPKSEPENKPKTAAQIPSAVMRELEDMEKEPSLPDGKSEEDWFPTGTGQSLSDFMGSQA